MMSYFSNSKFGHFLSSVILDLLRGVHSNFINAYGYYKATSKTNEDIHKVRCRSYSDVLPNGACLQHLKNYMINQSIHKAKDASKDMEWGILLLNLLKRKKRKVFLTRAFNFYFNKQRFHSCRKESGFNSVVNLLRLYLDRNFEKICECADMFTQLACFLRHPTCFVSTIKNETINSPPCRKIWLSNRCNGLIDFMKLYESLCKLCPDEFENPIELSNPYLYVNFPKQDMNNIVGCQLIPFKEGDVQYTEHCYEGNVVSYNGTVNKTRSGKKCLPWSINSFLSSPVYRDLESNFCRNPQGYARAPWCYVNETSERWEYCDVPECVNGTIVHKMYPRKIKLVFAVLVPTLLFMLLLLLWWKCWSQRSTDDNSNIAPYDFCSVSDIQKVSSLLKLHDKTIRLMNQENHLWNIRETNV
ncbi:uncharacterized protein LOC130657992 isoform X2 [Hydractinia symbiolongicarpus]|uniref:uncharacterized protein LOC130657992 isoform X2 n=1 Tax=Hydractinia symbiolongicarpus TaxID=13093 RepID=UPI00254BE4B5|nr:uncharacterized protein LOC130657992 isoform X2 [Hydractinia symbiolongicarpus]